MKLCLKCNETSDAHGWVCPAFGIVLTVPQHRWLWSRVDDFARHKRRYARQELVEKVVRSGFQIGYTASFVSLLLPLMLASRWQKESSPDMDGQMEAVGLKTGRLANVLLGAVMRIEWMLADAGLPLPFGGSLMLVARKPEK
jgi:hypothetical protein